VGYDNEFIYRKYMSLGPRRLTELKAAGII
jgi:hypothetical protein